MVITRVYNGCARCQQIPITPESLRLWQNGVPIQRAAPYLSDDQREFILTGITADEWADLFGDTDEIEEDLTIYDPPLTEPTKVRF